ncbi:uncharacterized protein LOC111026523 [Myzus persicae]|uniref:uncharacterized protein LOC111026523 n=1 Tax=Myzus persicae TaxID=13164 RepID=UPI000B9366EA|nr:uncharacterized protein LOC111026523 [Myzus persicae]
MNINYAQGIVLIVIACVLHTSCSKTEKSDKQLVKVSSKSNDKDDKKSLHDEKKKSDVEEMLLNIASIIQECLDNRTMNNKEFKIKLDKLYFNLVKTSIQKLLDKQLVKVKDVQKKYEKDLELLKIMNSMPDNGSSKNKDKSLKKSIKK